MNEKWKRIKAHFLEHGEAQALAYGRRLGLSQKALRARIRRWRSDMEAKKQRYRRSKSPLLHGSNEPKIRVISHIEGFIPMVNKKGKRIMVPKVRTEFAEPTIALKENEKLRTVSWHEYAEKLGTKAYLKAVGFKMNSN